MAVRRWVWIERRISTSHSQRFAPRISPANSTGSRTMFRRYAFLPVLSSFSLFFIGNRTYRVKQLNESQWLAVLAGELVPLRRGVAVDLGRVVEDLDPDLDRAHV